MRRRVTLVFAAWIAAFLRLEANAGGGHAQRHPIEHAIDRAMEFGKHVAPE